MLVTSRLDYCQSLNTLYRVQNSAALILTGIKYDPIITGPITEGIHYKILRLTFKALHDMGPVFVSDLLILYKPAHNLWSPNGSEVQAEHFG